MKVTVELEFDPQAEVFRSGLLEIRTHKYGGVRYTVKVNGEGVEIPVDYVPVLLNKETVKEGYRLFHATLQFNKPARNHLLETAAKEGFEKAWKLTGELEKLKPRSITLYLATCEDSFKPDTNFITVTDGKTGFSVHVEDRLYGKLQHLPLNAYVDAKRIWTPYLNESDFVKAQEHINKFFEFLCRLDRLQTVRSQRANTITKKFFEDMEEAFKQLKKAEKDEKLRRERDYFWLELKEKGAVKVEGGYLAYTDYCSKPVVYVTEQGEIFLIGKMDDWGGVEEGDAKEKAFKIYRSGKVPEKMKLTPANNLDNYMLKAIARNIGKLNPALALILTP